MRLGTSLASEAILLPSAEGKVVVSRLYPSACDISTVFSDHGNQIRHGKAVCYSLLQSEDKEGGLKKEKWTKK